MKFKFLFLFVFIFSGFSYSQSANFAFQQGEELLEKQQYEQAIEKFKYVLQKDPYYYEAYYDMGLIYLKTNKKEDAYENFRMAIQTHSNYKEAYEQHAQLALELNKFKEGLNDFENLIRLSPKSQYYEKRAKLYEHLNKSKNMYEDLQKAIELKTDNPETYYKVALIDLQHNNEDSYLKNLSSALNLKNDYQDALYERGMYYFNHQKFTESEKDLKKLFSIKPDYNEQLAENLGQMAFDQQAWDIAISYYDYCIKMFKSQKTTIWINTGICQKNLKQYSEAIKTLGKAISYHRDNSEAYIERALVYDLIGKDAMSKNDFTKAIGIDPKNPLPYYRRGIYYLEKKKYDLSIADISLAIKYNKSAPADYYFLRGSCYFNIHQKDKACNDLSKAAEMGHKEAKKIKLETCF